MKAVVMAHSMRIVVDNPERPPDGTYEAIWGRRLVMFIVDGQVYYANSDIECRSPSSGAVVTVADGVMMVEKKRDNEKRKQNKG